MITSPQRLLVPVLLWLLSGCGGPPTIKQSPDTRSLRPLMLLSERELSGQILGQRLRQPLGLAVDRRGALYLSDAGNNRIIRFEADFASHKEIGGYGSQPGLFDQPSFLVVDNDLNLIVSDAGNRRLARYNSRLNYVDEISLTDDEDPLKYGFASGVAVNEYGEVWMCDRENNRIAVFDNVGQFSRFIGEFGYSGGQLSNPEKIVYDSDEGFLVCDAGNSRIVVYDCFGNYARQIADEAFEYPVAVALDSAHNLWVLDSSTGRVFCFSKSGEKLLETGPHLPGTDRVLASPSDIAMLPDGRLVISDAGNHRVLICRIVIEGP